MGSPRKIQAFRVRAISTIVAIVVAMTALGAAPAAAQGEPECRGGLPDYWLANPWPAPFKVPFMFRKPNGVRATVRPKTKFDAVYRYRYGRDQEGRIFGKKRMRAVLKLSSNAKQRLARQAIAALLNAAERPNNEFAWTKREAIMNFQVYWDGTADMSVTGARKYMTKRFKELNEAACPTD